VIILGLVLWVSLINVKLYVWSWLIVFLNITMIESSLFEKLVVYIGCG
jgi:hypothetical protein